jgi:hypothetical protein
MTWTTSIFPSAHAAVRRVSPEGRNFVDFPLFLNIVEILPRLSIPEMQLKNYILKCTEVSNSWAAKYR